MQTFIWFAICGVGFMGWGVLINRSAMINVLVAPEVPFILGLFFLIAGLLGAFIAW